MCVHSFVAEVSFCGFVILFCSTNSYYTLNSLILWLFWISQKPHPIIVYYLIYSIGIQSFTSTTTSTASLTLKALLDFESTTSYELYLRITDTSNGWTGNITIKVNKFWSFLESNQAELYFNLIQVSKKVRYFFDLFYYIMLCHCLWIRLISPGILAVHLFWTLK